jgi:hypothetical protein
MIVKTERYGGCELILNKDDDKFQVAISKDNRTVAQSGLHTEGGSAFEEARRYVDALRSSRRR